MNGQIGRIISFVEETQRPDSRRDEDRRDDHRAIRVESSSQDVECEGNVFGPFVRIVSSFRWPHGWSEINNQAYMTGSMGCSDEMPKYTLRMAKC